MPITPMRVYLIALTAPAGEKGRGLARIEMSDGHGFLDVNATNLENHGKGEYHGIVIYRGGLYDAGALQPNAQGNYLKAPLSGIHGEIQGVLIILLSPKGNLHVILSGLTRGQKPDVLRLAQEQARIRWGMGISPDHRPMPPGHKAPMRPMQEQNPMEPRMAPIEPRMVPMEPQEVSAPSEEMEMQTVSSVAPEEAQEISAPLVEMEAQAVSSASIETEAQAQAVSSPATSIETAAKVLHNEAQAIPFEDVDMKIWEKPRPVSTFWTRERGARSQAPEMPEDTDVLDGSGVSGAVAGVGTDEAAVSALPQRRPVSNAPFPSYPVHEMRSARMGDVRLGEIIFDSQLMPQPSTDDGILSELAREKRAKEFDDHMEDPPARDRIMEDERPRPMEKGSGHMEDPFDRLRRGRPCNRQFIPNPFPDLYPRTRWVMIQYPGMYAPYYLASELTLNGRKLWAAAVPGEFDTTPPPWLPGFLRFRRARGGQGYWVALQDPETGEFFDDER